MITKTYVVKGMHCQTCEIYIESQLIKIKGVSKVTSNSKNRTVTFSIEDGLNINKIVENINNQISEKGYKILSESEKVYTTNNLFLPFLLSILLILLFILINKINLGYNFVDNTLNLPEIFIIGIIASLSTCMTVVGTLVLTYASYQSINNNYTKNILLFHISRILSFTILGGILGILGSFILFTKEIQLILYILVTLSMLLLGLKLLNKTFLQITLPKNISKKILYKLPKQFAPISLGFFTFFLPCGFTQSIQLQAILSKDVFLAAQIMLIFSLGTLPILLLISFIPKISTQSKYKDVVLKTAGFLILYFSIYNIYSILISTGIIYPI